MPKPKTPTLTAAQIELVAQFADYAFDHPGQSFDEIVRRVLPRGFGKGAAAKYFRQEAKKVFDRERAPFQ